MLKVGVTGGIGSGKSLVCKVFNCFGVPVYNADERAKLLYDIDTYLQSQIIELFGVDLYSEGKLNRKLLASIIFNDAKALVAVNALVHPAVEQDFKQWANKQNNTPYVIQEAAILFESGVHKIMDKTITISSPQSLRIKRASLRDNVLPEEIKRRMDKQMTDEEREHLANYIIISNDIDPMLPQIIDIHRQLVKLV